MDPLSEAERILHARGFMKGYFHATLCGLVSLTQLIIFPGAVRVRASGRFLPMTLMPMSIKVLNVNVDDIVLSFHNEYLREIDDCQCYLYLMGRIENFVNIGIK
jgi:hypothetical protein